MLKGTKIKSVSRHFTIMIQAINTEKKKQQDPGSVQKAHISIRITKLSRYKHTAAYNKLLYTMDIACFFFVTLSYT